MVRLGYGKYYTIGLPIGYLGWLVGECGDDGNFCKFGAILAFISDRMIPDLSTLGTSLQIYNGIKRILLLSGESSPALFLLVLLILPTMCPFCLTYL